MEMSWSWRKEECVKRGVTWSCFARTCSGPQADLHAAQGRNTRGDATTGSCLMEAVVCGSFLQFFPGLSAAVSAC